MVSAGKVLMDLVGRQFVTALFVTALSIAVAGSIGEGSAAGRQLAVAWDDPNSGSGMVRAMDVAAPWDYTSSPLAVGRDPVLRFAEQSLFVVSPADDTIQVVDPLSWSVERTYPLPAQTTPTDVAVIDAHTAYVSPSNSSLLLRLNLDTGDVTPAVDLSPLFPPGGVPDLRTMIAHDGRLFVQMYFVAVQDPSPTVLAGSLAVVDVSTEQLVDADPNASGTQSVQLEGTGPKFKMQVIPSTNELFVSATGSFFDDGGIEVVDLDTLTTKGLIVKEAAGNTAADVSAFVMLTPDEGYLTFTTDFATSSHLHQFSRDGTVDQTELHVSVPYLAPGLIHDPQSGQLFIPQGGFSPAGIQVFDAASGEQLTTDVISFGNDPTDLVLFDTVPEPCSGMFVISLCLFLNQGRVCRL